MSNYLVAVVLLPASMTMAYFILRRPIREICEEIGFEKARQRFRHQRERLEARFLGALDRIDPNERLRWDDADWRSEVVWARDRKTRALIALSAVRFAPEPFSSQPDRFATALFEYRAGQWTTQGQWLDEVRPDEAVQRQQRLEPVIVPTRRPSEAGGPTP